ncbi:hypothetical protein [Anaerocaecibacter muris]|uniref:hypothetical protein n=1 Tax=Anaerocaecibacter muris TaxID=2941513 RepID=UPI003F68CC41
MREKKRPKSNLFFVILCALYVLVYIIFYFTYAQAHSADRVVMAIIVIGGLLLVVVIVTLFINVKYCLNYQKYKRVMQYGTDGVCTLFDFKQIKYNGNKWDTKFALVLHYFDNGIEKSYTTGYDFYEAEFEYLKKLKQIKCRFSNGILFVTENIPETVYKDLTTYGKIESKFMRVFIKVWYVIGTISVIIALVGIALTIAMANNLYLIIGLASCFGVNVLCSIVYAVCFFAGKV